jgi:5-carboxymethyl-2-hydroxymuconate isomerase
VDRYVIGTAPGPRAFVHAQLRLLSGRSSEANRDLSDRIDTVLRRLAPRPECVPVQLSVAVVDMDRGFSAKERL